MIFLFGDKHTHIFYTKSDFVILFKIITVYMVQLEIKVHICAHCQSFLILVFLLVEGNYVIILSMHGKQGGGFW